MKNNLIGQRYGRALFEIALEKKKINELLDDTLKLKKIFEDNPKFIKLVISRFIEYDQKKELLNEIIENLKLKEIWANTFNILLDKKRVSVFSEILEALEEIIYKHKDQIRIKLFLARNQNKETINSIKAKLKEIFHKDIIADVIIDPKLIGGFKAQTTSVVVDGSIYHNLIKFSKIEKIV